MLISSIKLSWSSSIYSYDNDAERKPRRVESTKGQLVEKKPEAERNPSKGGKLIGSVSIWRIEYQRA